MGSEPTHVEVKVDAMRLGSRWWNEVKAELGGSTAWRLERKTCRKAACRASQLSGVRRWLRADGAAGVDGDAGGLQATPGGAGEEGGGRGWWAWAVWPRRG